MNHMIKSMPQFDRPDEKLLSFGAQALTDEELLAVIIRTGTNKMNSVALAKQIIGANDAMPNLSGLHRLSHSELLKIPGVGQVKALQIQSICELSKRMAAKEKIERIQLNNPESIADYFMEYMRHETHEEIHALYFDVKHGLIHHSKLSIGTISQAITSPREVFIDALRYEAVYVVLLHNHPSGDPSPSVKDIQTTNRMKEAGKILGITLSDHIVIGDKSYVSFRERGLLE